MMSTMDYHARDADAAAYAQTLQHDLARVSDQLNTFRGATGLELMHERSRMTQQALETIARRIGTLARRSDMPRCRLSDAEHTTLDTARDLRERMMESLARYQRAGAR